jgi:hypothetical protein
MRNYIFIFARIERQKRAQLLPKSNIGGPHSFLASHKLLLIMYSIPSSIQPINKFKLEWHILSALNEK